MANLDFYNEFLKVNDIDAICEYLLSTFLETNYTARFFVDWEKVKSKRDEFKYEFVLLQNLHNSTNIKNDYRILIERHPETIKAIPRLLALRGYTLKLIDLFKTDTRYQTIHFDKTNYQPDELDEITNFVEASGLLDMLKNTSNFLDYTLGVEVGLDSNARKNRSGIFLERMVDDILTGLDLAKTGYQLEKQIQFKKIRNEYNIPIPNELLESKADFILIRDRKILNIEANFYSGSGSKPSEIVNSYANRNRLLKSVGGHFIWLTDGPGWSQMYNPLKTGVRQIDYVLNTELLRHGALDKILAFF